MDATSSQRTAVLELLTCEYQALLRGRDAYLHPELRLDTVDVLISICVHCNRSAARGLDQQLHGHGATTWHDRAGDGGRSN
jgi:hypothetical protein